MIQRRRVESQIAVTCWRLIFPDLDPEQNGDAFEQDESSSGESTPHEAREHYEAVGYVKDIATGPSLLLIILGRVKSVNPSS